MLYHNIAWHTYYAIINYSAAGKNSAKPPRWPRLMDSAAMSGLQLTNDTIALGPDPCSRMIPYDAGIHAINAHALRAVVTGDSQDSSEGNVLRERCYKCIRALARASLVPAACQVGCPRKTCRSDAILKACSNHQVMERAKQVLSQVQNNNVEPQVMSLGRVSKQGSHALVGSPRLLVGLRLHRRVAPSALPPCSSDHGRIARERLYPATFVTPSPKRSTEGEAEAEGGGETESKRQSERRMSRSVSLGKETLAPGRSLRFDMHELRVEKHRPNQTARSSGVQRNHTTNNK